MGIFTEIFVLDILGLLTALLAISYVYFKWCYQYWKRRNVPCIEPAFPFGIFQLSFGQTGTFGKEFQQLYKNAKANGWKHYGLYSFTSPSYMPMDLNLIKNILAKDFHHFNDKGAYINERDDPLGCHMVNLGGQKWRNLRTKVTPTFSSGKLKTMFQTVVDCGLVLEKYFEESENRIAVDMRDVLGRYTTNVIGSCAFGIDCNSFEEPNSPFRIYGKRSINRTAFESVKNKLAFSFPNLARTLHVSRHDKGVEDFFTKVVHETVAYRETNNFVRKDFLQLLIDLRNNETQKNGHQEGTLTMSEIVAQSYVFFVAGFDTSSATMTFTLYHLATHLEIQEKVREELKTVLAKHDNQITYDSINDLKYLGQVIDETLRMFPPLPTTIRVCTEDYKIPDEDLVIEKNTRITIPIYPIHYDEEYYKNPEVFDPDRFSEENKKLIPQYAYLPFGEGPRICIDE